MEGLHKAMQMLMKERDGVVCQEPAYPGVISGVSINV
jgi:aspartate/methionine/tyrosine aminotransferase